MTSTTAPPRLSDDRLAELLKLLQGADTVELKLTVPNADRRAAKTLGVDPLEAQVRQVYFFDTPELTLNQHGLVVRARRVQNKEHDTVVKLRPVVPSELAPGLRSSPNFGVEVDAMPGGYVCSGSMKRTLGTMDVWDFFGKKKPLRKLFSKEQRALYEEHAPEGLAIDDLSVLGPIFVLKLKFLPTGFTRKIVAELWLYPDNTMLIELSTKCAPSEMFNVAAETRAYLSQAGVDLAGEQETKTKKALEYFAGQLRDG